MEKYDIKNVEVNVDLFDLLDIGIEQDKEFRQVIRSLMNGISKGKEPEPTMSELGFAFYDKLYKEAQARAEAFDKRKKTNTSNGKNGGRPKKRVEPAPEEESDFLKSLENE